MALAQLELVKMENKKVVEIKKRINWLKIELIHEGYLDCYSIEKYREELKKLETELINLEKQEDEK